MWAIRKIIVRVFPDPAPAMMSRGPSMVDAARYCSGFNSFCRSTGTFYSFGFYSFGNTREAV
jgi:hypothetical protein